MKKHYALGVIGGGFMARAILSGALAKNVLSADSILVCDPSEDSRSYFRAQGIDVSKDNRDAVQNADYVLFAVKPQTFPEVAKGLKGERFPVIISIMAGKTKESICRATGAEKVARIMPNLPCSVGAGMTAIDASELEDAERSFVLGLFLSVGEVIETDEGQLNAVTAVSGSGPAYVYLFLRSLIHAAEEQGLRPEQAVTLAYQTMEGGLTMAKTSGKSLDDLIAAVSSKGGTTIAALDSFHGDDFEGSVSRAVAAAARRAGELSE